MEANFKIDGNAVEVQVGESTAVVKVDEFDKLIGACQVFNDAKVNVRHEDLPGMISALEGVKRMFLGLSEKYGKKPESKAKKRSRPPQGKPMMDHIKEYLAKVGTASTEELVKEAQRRNWTTKTPHLAVKISLGRGKGSLFESELTEGGEVWKVAA